MFAVITTDEYKELIEAQGDLNFYKNCYELEKDKARKLTNDFNELLLLITKGQKKSEWSSGIFNNFDLADPQTIAEYINEKYLEDGILKLRRMTND